MNASILGAVLWGSLLLISGVAATVMSLVSAPEVGVEQPDPVRIFSVLLGATLFLTGTATLIGTLA